MFEACVDLPCELTAVAVARRFVTQTVRSWELDTDHLDDAVLLTSELVANAVLHARTEMRVTVLARDDGSLRVEVYDDNSRLPAAAAPPDDATSGRGLQVIEHVSTNWGFERVDGGKAVWFEVGEFRHSDMRECVDLTDVPSVDEALDEIERLVNDDR
jgi:anti-sigma regulatory factor (Ser/Thr protein kinase)